MIMPTKTVLLKNDHSNSENVISCKAYCKAFVKIILCAWGQPFERGYKNYYIINEENHYANREKYMAKSIIHDLDPGIIDFLCT